MARQKASVVSARYRAQPIRLELLRALAKAAPPEKPKEISDRAAGLILRHEPSGALSFYVALGRGKRVRPWEQRCDARRVIDPNSDLTLGMVKEEALRLRARHADGEDISALRRAKRAVPTLAEYLDETYAPWVKANRRSGAATLARIESNFRERFGKHQLTQITPAKMETWKTARKKAGRTAETINRDISALRAALSRAVRLKVIKENPIADVEPAEVDRHRRVVRALTANEKEKLSAALVARDDTRRQERANANEWRRERGYKLKPAMGQFTDVLTPAVLVSLETGLRRGELFGLEWPSIELEGKELRVEGATAKTFETRDVPLNEQAHRTLRDWWLQCGQPKAGYVFTMDGGRLGSLKKSYYGVLADAGIQRINAKGERVNWHSLRHTFGSLLGAANCDPTTLMKLMGHANLKTTQRYLHTDQERKRAAVDLLNAAPADA